MQLLLLPLLLLTLPFNPDAKQDKRETKKLQAEILYVNNLLAAYDTLDPFSGPDNVHELIDSINSEISKNLLNVLNNDRILKYDLKEVFDKEKIEISGSKDGKIFFFSIDEKTGGSFRPAITHIFYRAKDGKPRAEYFDVHENFDSGVAYYGDPILIDSIKQKYFVIGGVTTCNTCYATRAMSLSLDSATYSTEIIDSFDGRYYDLKTFEYDTASAQFTSEYFEAYSDDSLYGSDSKVAGMRMRYLKRFKIINGSFVLVENSEFLEEME